MITCSTNSRIESCTFLLACLYLTLSKFIFFFFQAEDGIRDVAVTGVRTCALPISDKGARQAGKISQGRNGRRPQTGGAYRRRNRRRSQLARLGLIGSETAVRGLEAETAGHPLREIGRAACRERV